MPEADRTPATSSIPEHRDGSSDDVLGPIGFLDIDRQGSATADRQADRDPASPDGGDLSCWASLVCLGCGGVTTDPGHDLQHRRWLAALGHGHSE
jgi:hypothetical protein